MTTKPKVNKTYTTADFARWGEIGGKAAKGDKKRRTPDHYKKLGKLGGLASGKVRKNPTRSPNTAGE